jgi:hypothetical protein
MRSPSERLPTKILYEARAVADRIAIMKNRDGKQSKLQKALGRIKEELRDDEVVVVIRASELHQDFSAPKSSIGSSTMYYVDKMTGEKKTLGKMQSIGNLERSASFSIQDTSIDVDALKKLMGYGVQSSILDEYATHPHSGAYSPLTSGRKLLDSLEE